MANKQLLELVRMRVRYNDINNETLLLWISPLTAETRKQEVKRTPWSSRFQVGSKPSVNLLEQWTIPSWPHKQMKDLQKGVSGLLIISSRLWSEFPCSFLQFRFPHHNINVVWSRFVSVT
jgi:hypothetical protein